MTENPKNHRTLNVIKVTPGWGFLEQVLPVIVDLSESGDATEVWVPEPWITHLLSSQDRSAKLLTQLDATFVAPNGFGGLTITKHFAWFRWRNRLTSVIFKFAQLLRAKNLMYPSPESYNHSESNPLRIFADCYFYHSSADLSLGQRLLRDADLERFHYSFYHGNFDPLDYAIPDKLPPRIDIHCYYREQYHRLQHLANDERRVLLSVLPRLAKQLDLPRDNIPDDRTICFFSRDAAPPSGITKETKLVCLKWISDVLQEHNFRLLVQLHPSESPRNFHELAKKAGLTGYKISTLPFSWNVQKGELPIQPLLAVMNFAGLVPNLVQEGIPCIELWPIDTEDYSFSKGRHRFDFSARGMSEAVATLDEFKQITAKIVKGDQTLLDRQLRAVEETYLQSGFTAGDLVMSIKASKAC